MTTAEERDQFCRENPDDDRCGCQRLIEDFVDRYAIYEKKENLRRDWWNVELAKYNKAYKNVKNFVPVGTKVYDLFTWSEHGGAGSNHLFNSNLKRNQTWTCQPDAKNLYICGVKKDDHPDCGTWFPHLCKNGGCDWYDAGGDANYGCNCDESRGGKRHTDDKVYGCKINAKGQRNILKEWENDVGKKYYPGYCDADFKDESVDDVDGRNCTTYKRIFGTLEPPEQVRAQCCANTIEVTNVMAGGNVNLSDVAQKCQQEINENLNTQIQTPDIAEAVEASTESGGSTESEATIEVVSPQESSDEVPTIVIIIIILLIILIAIYFIFFRKSKQSG